MTTSDAHAGRLSNGRSRHGAPLLVRLLAVARAPVLDADLADGIRPSASCAHRLRAKYLCGPRARRRIARALHRAIADANSGASPRATEIPLSHEAINGCAVELNALVDAVATLNDPRTRGLAIASQLAFDGCGPLFVQAWPSDDGRLANTVQTALSALEVSSEFDQLED